MFSEQQRDYIRQLVLAQKQYKYYVARTNTNVNGQGSYDDYTFYIYLSNKPFTYVSAYSFQTDGDVLSYAVRGANGSYNYHSQRISTGTGATTLSFNTYEFIYTNAEYSTYALQPDCLIPLGVQQSHFDGFSSAILIVLVSVILCKMMLKGGGGFGRL